jgi:hypothetical protein
MSSRQLLFRAFYRLGFVPWDGQVERRFAADWSPLSSGNETELDHNGKSPARYYLFQRAS